MATVFMALTWWAKEVPALEVRQPWQDDPFDVLVSLDYVMVPLLVVAGALRVQLCRRQRPLPARRVADLLRLCLVVLVVVAATQASQWVATVLGLHRRQWDGATGWQLAALALLSGATVAVGVLVAMAARAVANRTAWGEQPDWLADALTWWLWCSQRLTSRPRSVRAVLLWVDMALLARVRRHPVVAAGAFSCVLAIPFVASKVLLEGYPPLLILLSFVLPAAGLFAFTVIVGRFLRIVAPRRRHSSMWPAVAVAGCIAGTALFSFHGSLLSHPTPAAVNALLFGGGLAGALICLIVQLCARRRRSDRRNG